MTAPSPRVPLWKHHAEPRDTVPADALTLSQVASETGLKPTTVTTAMHSTAHTGRRSLLRRIARPAYNVGGVPYWTPEQAADYFSQIQDRFNVRREFSHLMTLDRDAAREIRAASLRGLSRLSTVPIGSLHRWKLIEGFPPPIAIMEVDSPTPQLLYSWPSVASHIERRHARWLARHPELDLHDPAREEAWFGAGS